MTSGIIATCGHEVTWDWHIRGLGSLCIKEKDKDGRHIIVNVVVCRKCFEAYKEAGVILKTDKEKKLWLNENVNQK